MKRFFYGLLGLVYIVVGLWLFRQPAHAQISHIPALYNGSVGLCRMGVNADSHLGDYPINPLRLGWFIDYKATHPLREGISYFPVVRLEQTSTGYNFSYRANRQPATEAQLRAVVAAKPGLYWIIGNEPDRIFFQDDVEPHIYARAYHDLYHIIKDEDPTARIVAGTIVQPTPIRLQYLDLVLESYFDAYQTAMPVDAWAFHNFVLNEASCTYYQDKVPAAELQATCWGADIPPGVDATDGLRIDVQANDSTEYFAEQVIRFRQWMADRGYRNTPAFLSEFGVLMPKGWYNPDFDETRVNNFMNWTFDFLMTKTDPNIGYPGDNNRLVQRFAWYSIDNSHQHNGYLFDPNLPVESSRTAMGDNFVAFAKQISDQTDFYVQDVSLIGAPPLNSQGATTVTLAAVIGNSGNLAVKTPATVRFFNGIPGNGGVQIGSDQTISLEGCGEHQTVELAWGNVAPGDYTIYVQIAPVHGEVSASNNRDSVEVSFRDNNLFIPTIERELQIPQ